jgi:amino acid transporter
MPEPAAPARAPRRATTFHLVFLTYSVVCSGAYGLEEMISASGPGLAIVMMLVLPILWVVPLALTCSELSSHHPVEGGYYRWARMAFGDFVGYQAGWLVWLANLATNAAFAVLFTNYLKVMFPALGGNGRWLVALAVIWGTTILNILGIRLVGDTSVILTALIFLPFLFMTIGGLFQWHFNPMLPFAHPDRGIGGGAVAGLMIAIWLFSGYEKLTPNAGEVENPSRAFPIALAFTVPMVVGSYLIPTVAGLAACDDWSGWGEAHFSVLAGQIGGAWLKSAMTLGGLVSNACILMVTILGQSRLPMVMAEDGLFPRFFGGVSRRFGTPVVSLLVGGVALSVLARQRFTSLTGLFSLVQVLAYVLICAALLRLRRVAPPPGPSSASAASAGGSVSSQAAPFRVPLGRAGLLLMMTPVFAIAAFVVGQQIWNGGRLSPRQLALDLAVFGSGPLTYALFRRPRGETKGLSRPPA